jgi:hypothetical protein
MTLPVVVDSIARIIPHLCGLPKEKRKKRVLVMLRAFLDESGDSGRDPAFIIAGWVSPVQDWESFSDDWLRALQNPPAIKYFKCLELFSRREGEFKDFSEEERKEKVLGLAEVICTHRNKAYGVVTTLGHEAFDNLVRNCVLSKRQLRNYYGLAPYNLCFHAAVSMTLQTQLHQKNPNKVDFIFDERQKVLQQCARAYWKIKQMMHPAMREIAGTVVPADDKTVLPLQAADLLAGEMNRYVTAGRMEPPLEAMAGSRVMILHSPVGAPELNLFPDFLRYANIVWAAKCLSEGLSKIAPPEED